jgi:hypothetical protein
VLVAARVLLGERRLVVPAQHRVTGFALVQHGLELALVLAVDPPSEQMGGSLGAAYQHAQFAGTLDRLDRLDRETYPQPGGFRPCVYPYCSIHVVRPTDASPRNRADLTRPQESLDSRPFLRFAAVRRLRRQVSATSHPSSDHILSVICELSGIPLDALQSPRQLRKLGPAKAAAAHLLRFEGGLSVQQVAPLLCRSGQTICEFSRNAGMALDQGGTIAELITHAKQVLDASARNVPSAPPEPGSRLHRTSRPSRPRATAVTHLADWRARSGLSVAKLAERSGIPTRPLLASNVAGRLAPSSSFDLQTRSCSRLAN